MASKRQLKDKLQAVGNIKQMTRAMQLVAATKMRKSQERSFGARPYALFAMKMLLHILGHSAVESLSSPFFGGQGEKTCLVVVTSDRGLAGAFNSQVLKRAAHFLEDHPHSEVVAVGKKAKDFFKKRKTVPAKEFFDFSDVVGFSDSKPLADWLIGQYLAHAYGAVFFCSTQFISALDTRVEVYQVLPLEIASLQNVIDSIIPQKGKYSHIKAQEKEFLELTYILEPSSQEIFEKLVEDLVRVEILYFLFESNASEHSSRMIAMKNATDNAENLLSRLTLDLNKLRQSSITQELTEISTAKEALTNE